MGMGFAPTWLRQVSPLLHMTTLTTVSYRAKFGHCWPNDASELRRSARKK